MTKDIPKTIASINSPKVLLVDDKPNNLVALQALLEEEECEFHLATSGEEALGLAYKNEYALMLIDVQMPNMDGFELTKILKSNKRTKNCPIVFVTAHESSNQKLIQAYSKGAVDYLFKPLNPYITQSKVHVFLEMYKQRQAIEALNASLQEKNKELIDQNKALEDFANIISHDLREPIRTITSFLKIIHKRNANILDERSLEFIDLCHGGATRLDTLIKDLRSYATTAYKTVEQNEINLDVILQNVQINLYQKLEDSKAQIIIDKPLPIALGNEIQFTQLLQNLIDNAIKYQAKDNTPIIKINYELYNEKGKNFWLIKIKDNGLGIKKRFQAKAFGVFQRLHTTTQIKGTGVGLSICKKIVENNGGKIWLESEEGKGTTFFFTIPFFK